MLELAFYTSLLVSVASDVKRKVSATPTSILCSTPPFLCETCLLGNSRHDDTPTFPRPAGPVPTKTAVGDLLLGSSYWLPSMLHLELCISQNGPLHSCVNAGLLDVLISKSGLDMGRPWGHRPESWLLLSIHFQFSTGLLKIWDLSQEARGTKPGKVYLAVLRAI